MAKKPDREARYRELLQIRKENAAAFVREDEIKTALRADVTENFQIRIDKLGLVKVSAPKEKRCIGTAPEIVVEAFLRLPDGQRKSLVERGIVVEEQQWKSATTAAPPSSCFKRLELQSIRDKKTDGARMT